MSGNRVENCKRHHRHATSYLTILIVIHYIVRRHFCIDLNCKTMMFTIKIDKINSFRVNNRVAQKKTCPGFLDADRFWLNKKGHFWLKRVFWSPRFFLGYPSELAIDKPSH